MPKAWDIIGRPRAKQSKTKTVKKQRSSSALFWMMVILLFIVSVLYTGSFAKDNWWATSPPKTVNSPSSKPSSKSSALTIKILNGTGQFELTDQTRDLLMAAGYSVDATESALNMYDQTIIYYNPGQDAQAAAIAQVLKSYNPQIQKFTTTSRYDIAIILGTKK